MTDRKTEVANPRTLTDEQILTERKFPRRSFLTAAGTLLVGGAAALVSGVRAAAQDTAPAKKQDDPDKKKEAGSKSGKAKTDKQANNNTRLNPNSLGCKDERLFFESQYKT